MLERLKRKGFTEAERVGRRKSVTVVRAYHPDHGWMYEKIAETDEAASDASVDAWFSRASEPRIKPKKVGAR